MKGDLHFANSPIACPRSVSQTECKRVRNLMSRSPELTQHQTFTQPYVTLLASDSSSDISQSRCDVGLNILQRRNPLTPSADPSASLKTHTLSILSSPAVAPLFHMATSPLTAINTSGSHGRRSRVFYTIGTGSYPSCSETQMRIY